MGYKSRGNYPIKVSICQECGKVIKENHVRLCQECEDAYIKNHKRGTKR